MIKNTSTVNIEGTVIDQDELKSFLLLDKDDAKTKWLVKPLILISGVGLVAAAVVTSFFLMAVSLVIVPVLALAGWALKSNMEKAVAESTTATGESDDTAEIVEASDTNAASTGEPNPV